MSEWLHFFLISFIYYVNQRSCILIVNILSEMSRFAKRSAKRNFLVGIFIINQF
jgi:hypothetical protein